MHIYPFSEREHSIFFPTSIYLLGSSLSKISKTHTFEVRESGTP